ncbi:hypothetical protein K210099B7_24100 [Bacteroides xylanisolvens]
MQLHPNLETIIPRCPHNYIGILINDMRVSMNDIGILIYASSAYQYYNERMDRLVSLLAKQ